MKQYTLIDHTADMGIHVWGKDLKELFTGAALGMFAVVTTKKLKSAPSDQKKFLIQLEADILDDLLYEWLSELHSLAEAKNVIFTDFKIIRLQEKKIKAKAYALSRRYFTLQRDIKAVTYHGLKIQKKQDRYEVDIIFDL